MAKELKIGEAVYLDGTSIQISKPDDWGWLYRHNEDDHHFFVLIKIRKSGLIHKKWEAEIIEQNGESPIDSIIIDHHVDERNGLPYSFSAIIKIGDRTIPVAFNQQQRVSVNYYRNLLNRREEVFHNALLVEDSGYYQTKFFFVLGATGSGKTCWLHALQTQSVRDRIFRNSNILHPMEQPEQTPQLEPTDIDRIRFQKYYLVNGEGGKERVIKEVIFVVDLSSEINDGRHSNNDINMIRHNIRVYASGLFVVRNDKWLFGDVMNQYDPAGFVYHHLMEGFDALTEKDICYILTCADRIKKVIEDEPEKCEELNITSNSPIFKQTCLPEQMSENKAVTSDIMKRRDPLIGNSPCFAVSSCSEVENENGEKLLDFSQGYNAELPLIYMLGKPVKSDECTKHYVRIIKKTPEPEESIIEIRNQSRIRIGEGEGRVSIEKDNNGFYLVLEGWGSNEPMMRLAPNSPCDLNVGGEQIRLIYTYTKAC